MPGMALQLRTVFGEKPLTAVKIRLSSCMHAALDAWSLTRNASLEHHKVYMMSELRG
jgi:hypothetical protein